MGVLKRTRITKAAKLKRKYKGLPKVHTEGQYRAHKLLNKQRRKKKKRTIKKARMGEERAAKKVAREELAARKAAPDYKPMKDKYKGKPNQRRKGEKWILSNTQTQYQGKRKLLHQL